ARRTCGRFTQGPASTHPRASAIGTDEASADGGCGGERVVSMKYDTLGRIAGVVLAAGTSSRMGRNKLLLTFGGVSLIRRAVIAAGAGGLDPVLVVLGHQCESALAELSGLSCTPILNAEYARGMNGSVRAGISAVPADVSAAVVMVADMPFVSAGMLREMIDRYPAT